MLTPIQLILVIITILIIARTIFKWKKKELDTVNLVLWLFFWFCVIVAVLYPPVTTVVANFLGVGRGADAVIYFAFALLFYLIFRVSIRLYKIERDITKIVSRISLGEKRKDE